MGEAGRRDMKLIHVLLLLPIVRLYSGDVAITVGQSNWDAWKVIIAVTVYIDATNERANCNVERYARKEHN